MFAGKPNSGRKKGVRKDLVAFRCPEDVKAHLAKLQERGADRTEVIVKSIRVAKDVSERMGAEWWEVERRANVAGAAPGEILADLALSALALEKSPKPPKK